MCLSAFSAKYGGYAGLSVPIVNLPGVERVSASFAHASADADGATDGAVETAAAEGEGAAADGEALDPALLQAAARSAMSPSELSVVLRIGMGSSGGGDARECT